MANPLCNLISIITSSQKSAVLEVDIKCIKYRLILVCDIQILPISLEFFCVNVGITQTLNFELLLTDIHLNFAFILFPFHHLFCTSLFNILLNIVSHLIEHPDILAIDVIHSEDHFICN